MAGPGAPEVDNEAALYTVVPEQFVVARDALARRLRSGGDKAAAARIAKLRRPPPTAWALNQVVRNNPGSLDDLLGAGGRLRAAMEQALGGDASELRPAQAGERRAVDAFVAAAVEQLLTGGYAVTDVMRQRMAATLRAAIVDEVVADLLGHGVLEGDRDASGFGMESLSVPVTKLATPDHGEAAATATAADPTAADREAAAAAAADATAAERAAADAARVARQAGRQQELDRLTAEADRLDAEAQRLAAAATEAADRAEAAHIAAAAARQAVADARATDEA